MYLIILDIGELLEYARMRGVDRESIPGIIAQYLSKTHGYPIDVDTRYPITQPTFTWAELDRFFKRDGYIPKGEVPYLNEMSRVCRVIYASMDRSFLLLRGIR